MKTRSSFIVLVFVVYLVVSIFIGCKKDSGPPPDGGEKTHFGMVEAWKDYQATDDLGIEWIRFWVHWQGVQPEPDGGWHWTTLDDVVKEMQQHKFNILFTLQPFAQWDQDACRPPEGGPKGPPCDMNAYKNFIRNVVERYDGDGVADMPGLSYDVSHWEVFNEPSLGEFGYNFTPEQYYDLLKATQPVIKEACAQCQVVQAGVAGVVDQTRPFLEKYLALGVADYFDIANVHFIHFDKYLDETLFVEDFKAVLSKYDIDKPIWVTEVQIQSGEGAADPYFTEQQGASETVKAYVRAFALGANKIFYTIIKPDTSFPEFMNRATLIDKSGRKRPSYYGLKTLIAQVKGFISVETIVSGSSSGQYKFILPGKSVYVLWGTGSLPTELTGKVGVVSVDSTQATKDASAITLSSDPIFVFVPD